MIDETLAKIEEADSRAGSLLKPVAELLDLCPPTSR
jgi:hypothetical protein